MSYRIQDFVGEVAICAGIHRANPNKLAELNAIASLLATDPSAHSAEMTTAPAGLQPGNAANTKFTNDILLLVNAGKAGNLTPLAMGNAITSSLASFIPPVNTSAPAVTGTGTVGQTLTCTNGNWTYVPTEYQYQWLRGATQIAGATASTYVLVAADSGTNVSCMVTASNAAGSTTIASNTKAVA